MIRRKLRSNQDTFWIQTDKLQVQPQITFYSKLNEILDKMKFGDKVRELSAPHYSNKNNVRPPLDPEVYFKMLMIGFFENINSERGIASRCADSLSIRSFLKYDLTESTPDHSTLSITRKRLPQSIYSQVFSIILAELKKQGLVKGKNISMDSSVIEANAALKSLQNRMTLESYSEYISKLAAESGVDPKDKEAVARFDRKRKDRKTKNDEWQNPHDPDAKIGQTKHGATDMIYKPENIVDLDTGAIIDADILPGDNHDAHGQSERIIQAQIRLFEISEDPTEVIPIQTVTNDKGYFTVSEVMAIQSQNIETIIPDKEINRNTDKMTDEERLAIELVHSSVKSSFGKKLLRKRGMYVERSFAHILDSGGCRRTHLKGQEKNRKRYLIATACYNLSLLMRTLFGIGTPKQCVALLNFDLIWHIFTIFNLKNIFFTLKIKNLRFQT